MSLLDAHVPLVLPSGEHVPMVHLSLRQHVPAHHVHGVQLHVQAQAPLQADVGFPLVRVMVLVERVGLAQEEGEGWVVE